MIWYAILYVLGVVLALITKNETISSGLRTLEPITLTALVASLLVAFAGFSKTKESWQKFALQYLISPLFGVYTVVLARDSNWVSIVILGCMVTVHAAYWTSSPQSRAYRLEQFKLGFASDLPRTTQLVAILNALGHADKADEIITAIICGKEIDLAGPTAETGIESGVVELAHKEIHEFGWQGVSDQIAG